MNASNVFVSELISEQPREGAQVLAGELSRHLQQVHHAITLSRKAGESGRTPAMVGRFVGRRALSFLRASNFERIVYMPSSGLTLGAIVRSVLIWWSSTRPPMDIVLTQVHISDRLCRLLFRWRPKTWRLVVATRDQRRVLGSADDNDDVGLLSPRIPPSRIARLTKAAARQRLQIDLDDRVYLHVGHATRRRNLTVLQGLTPPGQLFIVVSDAFDEEPNSLPRGASVRVLRGFQEDMGSIYAAADVYVFPTVDPAAVIGLPMSVFEALANGVPVVALESAALRRWSSLPGLYICRDEGEFVSAARAAQSGQVDFTPTAPQIAECADDLSICLAARMLAS